MLAPQRLLLPCQSWMLSVTVSVSEKKMSAKNMSTVSVVMNVDL